MSEVILLSSVGLRDLQLTGEIELSFSEPVKLNKGFLPGEHMREYGALLLDKYEDVKDLLHFEFLESALQGIERDVEHPLGRIILFVTDQSDEKYRSSDTLNIGKLFKHHFLQNLKMQYSKMKTGKVAVEVRELHGNPADYDSTMQFFHEQFAQLRQHRSNSEWIVQLTGGTPQMTSMMMLKAQEFSPQPILMYYKQPNTHRAEKLTAGRTLFQSDLLKNLRAFVKTFEYEAARKLILDHQDHLGNTKRIKYVEWLLQSAYQRMMFDFSSAAESAEQAKQEAVGRSREWVTSWRQGLDDLIHEKRDELKFGELLVQIKLQFSKGDMIGFLGRLFRFVEASYEVYMSQIGVPDKKGVLQVRQWVEEQPELVAYLANYRGEKVEYVVRVTRFTYQAILDFFAERGQASEPILDTLKRLQMLANIRNHVVTTHGFQGVSTKQVADTYGVSITDLFDHLCQDLNEVYAFLITEHGSMSDPFQAVNEELERCLSEISAEL